MTQELTERQRTAYQTLRLILEDRHPCEDQACDIAAAMQHGCILWAAHSYYGATETPEEFGRSLALFSPEQIEEERLILLTYPHAQCPSCRSLLWGDGPEFFCSCGERLRLITRRRVEKFRWTATTRS